jgi:hypothetical protein
VSVFPRPARIENMVPTEETVAGYTPPTPLSTIGNFFSSETLLAAKEQYWLSDMAGRELVSQGFKDDPSWNPDLSAWEQQTKHVDPDLKLNILEARSGDHYNYLLTEAVNASRRRKILREAGYGGTMATVGAMITDPVSILTMAVGPIGVAGRTGIGAWATSGAINASLSLVTEGLRAELSPDLDASDAVTGAIGDFLFGFGIARANSMGANTAVRAATGFGAYAPSGALGAAWREDADIYDIGTAALVSGIMGGAFGAVAKTREAAAFDAATVRIANDWKTGRANFYTNGTIPTATVFNADDFVAAVSHVPPQQWAEMRAGRSDVPAAVTPAAQGASSPGIASAFGNMGGAITLNYYDAMLQRLANGKVATPFSTQSWDAQLVTRAYAEGKIKTAEDAQRLVNEAAAARSAATPVPREDATVAAGVAGRNAPDPEPIPVGGKQPWQMTRDEYEATGLAVYHGTNRQFDRFDAAALDRFGKERTRSDRFYFTEDPVVADTFANATGYKQISYDKWSEQALDAGKPSTLGDMRKAINSQMEKGAVLWYADPELAGRIVKAKSVYELNDDILTDGDVRLYRKDSAPRVIQTKIYGNTLDLTAKDVPDWVPDNIKKYGKDLGFAHEFDTKLSAWMRDNGVSAVRVKDVAESGFSSIVALPESIGFGRDAHREAVEVAVQAGKRVPASVLADYPDLAPSAPQPASPQLPNITDTIKAADWVRESIRNGRNTADRLGITQKIEDLSAQGLTGQQVAIRLLADNDVPGKSRNEILSDIVYPARASLGIPSQDDRVDFQAWLNARNARLAQSIPASQANLSALSSAIRAGGEGQTQSPTFVNPLLRPDFKLGDMDASRVSLSPATTTLYIKDKDTKVPITMSMTAWASKDAIDARGTWFANATGTNYVPHKDGSVNRGLIEQVGAAVSNDTGNFNTGLAAMYRVEAKKAKQSGVAMPKQDEWMAQVTRAARGFTTGAAPGVVEAANAMRRGLDTNLDYYLRHAGIKREEAGNVAGYVPRIQKRDELDRLVKELGHDGAVTFYKNAILSDMRQSRVGQNQLELFPDLTPDQVAAKDDKVARRMAEAAIQYGGTKSGRVYHAGMSRADAESVLDEIADLASDDKKHIIRSIFGRDEAANPRLRARTPLDESYSEVINDKTYTIEQLLENDPRVLYARYSHEMHSGSALEEAGRVYKALFNEDMPKTLAEFQQASAKWYAPGASSKSRAEALFRQLAGYAVHDLKDELDYALMGSTQVINAGVYMQVMATPRAGAMQITESLNHLVQPEVSVPFMRKLFPVIDELSTSAMSGQLSDVEIIADAQLAGFGRGYASRIPGHVMDAADGYAKKFGPVTTAAEKATHFGNKWMSGEGPIGNSQEIAVYAGAVGHWVDFAVGRTGPLSNARLKALNLTPELQTEIGAMIRRFGTKDKTGRVVMPNERAWSNQAAAAAFREAVNIATRRLTNFGDASSMPTFAAKWYGKLFLQLRRFALRATGNYLGFNARMADRHAALTTASAAATGMLQYVVANVIAAATMQDREDFLNERLATENIAKAAFARSAMAGIMPTVVDAGASAFGYDAPFSQYRQTYMATGASGVLANFAAADSLKNLTALPGAVLRPMIESDYDFSERNYNTITKGLFLPNYMGSLRAIREELNLPSRSETE